MLEIFGLIALCKAIGGQLERKGRRSGWFKFFVVIAWFGGEFFGGIVAGVVVAIMNPHQKPPMAPIYIAALGCAALSVGIVFLTASLLPDLRRVQPSFTAAAAPNLAAGPLGDPNNPYRAPNFNDRQ